MVRIVSTHNFEGEARNNQIYGWGDYNPEMLLPHQPDPSYIIHRRKKEKMEQKRIREYQKRRGLPPTI